MSEKRRGSDPTVPIPASHAREVLAAEGHESIPDETPTVPDLEVASLLCPECGGRGLTIEETATGYHGPVPCPRGCKARKS